MTRPARSILAALALGSVAAGRERVLSLAVVRADAGASGPIALVVAAGGLGRGDRFAPPPIGFP